MKLFRRQNSAVSSDQQGFTILELLIATTVFSVILLIATTGIIAIGKLYYKGITEARTSDATRVVMEEVSRTIQFSKGTRVSGHSFAPDTNITQFCVGDRRYTFMINQQVTDDNAIGLRSQTKAPSDACALDDPLVGDQVLASNMRLLDFRVESNPTTNNFTVNIKIAYGDDDLLNLYDDDGNRSSIPLSDGQCKSGIAGSSFCAVAQLDTTVKQRLQ